MPMTQQSTTREALDGSWPLDWFEKAQVCLFCGSSNLERSVTHVRDWFFDAVPGDFSFLRCQHCQSLALETRPRAEHLSLAYKNYYTHTPGQHSSRTSNPLKLIARFLASGHAKAAHGTTHSLLDLIFSLALFPFVTFRGDITAKHRFLPSHAASVLDYGCGNGDFLERARALGHDVVGVDFDPGAIAAVEKRGIEALLTTEIDEARFANRFDLISVNHVIEHVASPTALLQQLTNWLRRDGKIYIEVPNANAIGLREFGRFWRGLEAPRHFGIPSKAGLLHALQAAGLKIVANGSKSYALRELSGPSRAAMSANSDADEGVLTDIGEGGEELLICLATRQ